MRGFPLRRVAKWLGGILAVAILLPLVLIGLLLLVLNTAPGQREAESLLANVLGDGIKVTGISGGIPAAPRVAHVELRDATGVWLSIDDIALDWSPLRLLSGVAHIDRLSVAHVAMARLPVSDTPAQPSSGGDFTLPVRVEAEALHVGRVDIAGPVAGAQAALALDGAAHLASLQDGDADVTIRRLDGDGTYRLSGRIDAARLMARLDATEPARGLVATLATLPDLGPLAVHASIDGPWSAAATDLALTAGPLRAASKGTIDISGQAADLDVSASAPAMTPRPDMSWQSVALEAHVHGPFTKPAAAGTLRIAGLAASGAGIGTLSADVAGDAGQVTLKATAAGVRVPGPKPDVLGSDPLTLDATARLDAPDRPVVFSLAHRLLTLKGTAHTGDDITADLALAVPDLAPLASIGGVDLQGSTSLSIKAAVTGDTQRVDIDGTLGVTGGMAPVPGLIGPAARLGLSAALHGADVTLSRLTVDGKTVTLSANGGMTGGVVGLDWKLALSDLAVAAPTVSGAIAARGRVTGKTDDLAAHVDLTGDIATKGFPKGPIKLALDAQHLPGLPTGHVVAEGVFQNAPLTLDVTAQRDTTGTLHATIAKAGWKSAQADGALTLARGATLPDGRVTLKVARLADFSALAGQPLGGSLDTDVAIDAGTITLNLAARNAGVPAGGAGAATIDARVTDPLGHPAVKARLAIDGLNAGGAAGTVRLDLDGPEEALGLRLAATLENFHGGNLSANAAATIDVPKSNLTLASLETAWKGETLRLLAPARLSFSNGLSIDRLRLGLRTAELSVAGRVSPTLDLTATLRNVTADLARIVAPDIKADGALTMDARLTGTTARPAGTVRVSATGLRMRTGPASSLPAASILANVTLAGTSARIDARANAGRNQVLVAGTAPLDPSGSFALHAQGGVDLALLDPILSAQGQRLRGQITLDANATGTAAGPRATGSIRLADGEFQDFNQGARLDAIEAVIEATGDMIRIARFSAKAGKGTLSAGGTIGLAAPMPVDLTITGRNASPLDSDKLSASLNLDLTLHGAIQGALAAAGTIRINSAEIRVPEHLPATVAVLNVRRPGDKPPQPPGPGPDIGLNLTLDAPEQIFVRGRGLDAELQGKLTVKGNAAAPQIAGGFQMRRGSFSLAGTSLTFTTGEVTFDGSGKIDPTLNFIANSTNGTTTATLTVTGYASAPKIALSSVPTLPQDEVLAQLLFHQSAASLGPLQLAEIAAALAQISGVAGGGLDPLNAIRSGLGLDRLSVGGGSSGNSATVEAGRYVAKGIYVGAKQGTSGSGTQATVQVDITKGLKLEADVGTGGGSATGAASSTSANGTSSNGTSLGVTYQFEY
jgi:translocation and assembly module TamB